MLSSRPRMNVQNEWYWSLVISLFCSISSSSLVLPGGDSHLLSVVVETAAVKKAFVQRTSHLLSNYVCSQGSHQFFWGQHNLLDELSSSIHCLGMHRVHQCLLHLLEMVRSDDYWFVWTWSARSTIWGVCQSEGGWFFRTLLWPCRMIEDDVLMLLKFFCFFLGY